MTQASLKYRFPGAAAARVNASQGAALAAHVVSMSARSSHWLLGQVADAVVVSLDRRTDRRRQFEEGSAAAMVQLWPRWRWLSAVDAAADYGGFRESAAQDPRLSPHARVTVLRGNRRSHHELASLGAVGCYFSHLAALRAFVAADEEREQADGEERSVLLVFEDDAAVTAGFVESLLRAPPPPTGWDMVTFGPVVRKATAVPSSEWRRVTDFWGTMAYAVTARGARALLRDALPMEAGIDVFYSLAAAVGTVSVVAHPKLVVKQSGATASDIKALDCPLCTLDDTARSARVGSAMTSAHVLPAVIVALGVLTAAVVAWRRQADACKPPKRAAVRFEA